MREFTDGESNFAALLQRAMEMEGVDRETLHHIVTLLIKVCLTIKHVTLNSIFQVELSSLLVSLKYIMFHIFR